MCIKGRYIHKLVFLRSDSTTRRVNGYGILPCWFRHSGIQRLIRNWIFKINNNTNYSLLLLYNLLSTQNSFNIIIRARGFCFLIFWLSHEVSSQFPFTTHSAHIFSRSYEPYVSYTAHPKLIPYLKSNNADFKLCETFSSSFCQHNMYSIPVSQISMQCFRKHSWCLSGPNSIRGYFCGVNLKVIKHYREKI